MKHIGFRPLRVLGSVMHVTCSNMDSEFLPDDTYEPWLIPLYDIALSAKDHPVVCDVGANIGLSSLAFAAINPVAEIYAFEPLPEAYKLLAKNLEKNEIKNVTAQAVAISNVCGDATICLPTDGRIGDSYITGTPFEIRGRSEDFQVLTKTLADVVDDERLSSLDVLKIDVEGFEQMVLNGGRSVIQRFRPISFVEFNAQQHTCTAERFTYDLWLVLIDLFDQIYLVRRSDGRLIRIFSYAQLRILMLTGHNVEDLLCLYSEHMRLFSGKTTSASYSCYDGAVVREIEKGMVTGLQMYPDGWMGGDSAGLLTSSAGPVQFAATVFSFSDEPIDCRVYYGNRMIELGLDSTPRKIQFELKRDAPSFLWVRRCIRAADYWKNKDPRVISINMDFEEIRQ